MQLSGIIAVDANAVLSALIGGKASRVFLEATGVKLVTTAGIVGEINEYIPVLAKKKGLNRDIMEAAFSLLGVEVAGKEIYSDQIPLALDMIGRRDPDDVELVALALALKCPVWTNDNDLIELKQLRTFTTAEILCFF